MEFRFQNDTDIRISLAHEVEPDTRKNYPILFFIWGLMDFLEIQADEK